MVGVHSHVEENFMKSKPWLLVLLLALLVLAYQMFDVGRWLSLGYLQESKAGFAAWYAQHPFGVLAAFFAVYVASTSLSLPGATVLTLAAGALFGLGVGTLLVSVASTIGATVAMLVSRYLLQDLVMRRFGARLGGINRGLVQDGGFYLLSLRLMPMVPFFVLNLLMGLTTVRIRTFFWVSQVGMLPATLVYVNAGTQLARIESLSDVVSVSLLASLTALALLPWVVKWLVTRWQQQRILAPWAAHKPKRFDRNLIVIGAGAAGLVSTYIATAVKAKVTLVEAHKMGGDCLNYGCVPSKTLIKSAKLAAQMRRAPTFGFQAIEPTFNFKAVMARVRSVVSSVAPHDSAARYSDLGAEVLEGHARIINPWTVEVRLHTGEVRRLSTRSIILATGAAPTVPDLPGLSAVGYLTSDTVWDTFADLDAPPERLLILGGGPIGCELAQAFARLGSKVTLVQRAQRVIPREDEEVSAFVRDALEQDGVTVLTACNAVRCELHAGEKVAVLLQHDRESRLSFDYLLCAVGRQARLSGFGLEELGVPAQGTVQTNAYLQTLLPTIYAAGDVAGPMQFTHVAAHQAWYASVNALFGGVKRFKLDMRVIPRAIFVDPEVARVGLNEREARAQDIAYELTRYDLDDLDRAMTDGVAHGFVKVLTVPGKDRILGVTIVGEHAADLLTEFVLAMRYGLGLNKILGTVHTYPTMSEANKYAAGVWRRAHAPQRILAGLERYHAWRRG